MLMCKNVGILKKLKTSITQKHTHTHTPQFTSIKILFHNTTIYNRALCMSTYDLFYKFSLRKRNRKKMQSAQLTLKKHYGT